MAEQFDEETLRFLQGLESKYSPKAPVEAGFADVSAPIEPSASMPLTPASGSIFDSIARWKESQGPVSTVDNLTPNPNPTLAQMPNEYGTPSPDVMPSPPSEPALKQILGHAPEVMKARGVELNADPIPSGESEAVDLTTMGAPAPHPVQNLVQNPVHSQDQLNKLNQLTMNLGDQDDYKKQLQDAMKKRDEARDIADWGNIAGKLSSGILSVASKSDVKNTSNDVFDPIAKRGEQGLKDVQFLKEQEMNDPKSNISRAYKGYLERYGVKINGDISAAQVEKVLPMAAKEFELRYSKDTQRELATQRQNFESGENTRRFAHENELHASDQASRERIAGENAELRAELAKNKEAKGTKDFNRKTFNTVQQYLFGSRITPEVRQAKLDFYNAGKAEPLLARANQLSKGEMSLLISEVAKVAKGGVPDKEEYRNLLPSTAKGKIAELYSKVSNKPQAQQAGEFLKQYGNYLKEVKANAKKAMDNHFSELVEANKDDLGEKNYNHLKSVFYHTAPGQEATEANAAESNEAKSSPSGEKIKVSNGKETRLIDPSDLEHAKADGYERM